MTMDMYHDTGDQKSPLTVYECVVPSKAEKTMVLSNARVKQRAMQAMDELEGWCTKTKAAIMIDLIFESKAETVVEVGVWGGKSLIPMAFALKEMGRGIVYGIDPWSTGASVEGMTGANENWWGAVDHEMIYRGLMKKVAKFGLENSVELIRSTSADAPAIADIDLLHIDGNHSEKSSCYDVNKWVPLVRSGGLIVFDDITWGTTTQAVEWLNQNCVPIAEYRDESVWGVWMKP